MSKQRPRKRETGDKPKRSRTGRDSGGLGNRPGRPKQTRSKFSSGKPVSGDTLHLYGVHPVIAALENPDRQKHRLLATENGERRLPQSLQGTVSTEIVSPTVLDGLVGRDAVHQGLVLECSPLETLDASELFHLADAPLVLVLDQITDPHNVGAILRSAVAFNVSAVLLTHRNSAVETGVLAKSASGALDMVRTINIRNLSKALEELNQMGFATVGLDSEGPMVLEETLKSATPNQIALVLGSEGKGLRQQTRETCSYLARLDMPGKIKSLNVSNANALSLYIVSSALSR